MKLITQRQLIQNVAEEWRKQYEPFTKDWPLHLRKTKKQIADELDGLDKHRATAQDVDAIIGNNSWTRLTCDECGREVEAILRVGEEPDYESQTAGLCEQCVKSAAELISQPQSHKPFPSVKIPPPSNP